MAVAIKQLHPRVAVVHALEQSARQRHAEMNQAESVLLGASQVANTHVLAVDDDPSVRQMIVDYLGDDDIRVMALASGKQILEVMARDTIDLVVLDLRMLGEDGMEIARCSIPISWSRYSTTLCAGCAPRPRSGATRAGAIRPRSASSQRHLATSSRSSRCRASTPT